MTKVTKKNVELTDEMKQKLKGLMALSTETEFVYVPSVYRFANIPKEFWPVFRLKGKTGIQMADDEDNAGYMEAGSDRIYLTAGKKRLEVLRKNIVNWKNWNNAEGKEVKFKRDGVTGLVDDSCLKLMPTKLQNELVNAINDRDILTQEELQGLEY